MGNTEFEKRIVDLLFEDSPFAMLSLSTDGTILDCNRAFEQLFGYKKKTILLKSGRDVFGAETAESDKKLLDQALEKKEIVKIDTQRRHKNGQQIAVKMTATPVIISHEVKAVLIYFQDIHDQLEKEKNLEEAKRRAEQGTKAKSEFLANMSHEIRTPLNGVIGMANILIQSGLTESQFEMAQIVVQSGESLLNIVNNILDLSKIEASKLKLDIEPISIRQTVEDSIDIIAPRAIDKGLDVGYLFKKMTPLVYGDGVRLQQILVNLLSNGVKFTESGDVFVYVDFEKTADQKLIIQFDVVDSGIGIPENQSDQLFEAFSQIDAPMGRKDGGTGLGLAICRQLVQMMGGEISVTSEVGKGTTFSFYIKVRPLPALGTVDNDAPKVLVGKRLLVVEDNAAVSWSVARKTAAFSIDTTCTGNLNDAFSALKKSRFDIILLDLELPNDHSIQFLEWAEGDSTICNIPIVGTLSVGEKRELTKRVACIITKPLHNDNLRTALIQAVSAHHKQRKTKSASTYRINIDDPERIAILVAEDNLINRNVFMGLLNKMGLRADFVENGEKALVALAERPYDLVLMDIHMPKMDGVSATAEIYERFGPDDRPYIIAITANAFKSDRDRLLAAGMDDYVSKPIRIDQLVDAINQFVRKRFAPSS